MRLGMLLTIMCLVVIGCYPSESPIWTAETLVYYPELLGVYRDDTPATEKNTTTLEKGEADKSYRVVHRNGEGEKTGEATLRLVKLGDSIFYDYERGGVKLDKVDPPLKEFHIFGRLKIEGKKLQLYSFNANVLVDEIFRWKTVKRGTKESRVIANTTQELQAFLKANEKQLTVEAGSFTKLRDSH